MICLTNYDHFEEYDVNKKNAPARNAPAGRDTSEFGMSLGEKKPSNNPIQLSDPNIISKYIPIIHPNIISNNPIQYSYQIYYI